MNQGIVGLSAPHRHSSEEQTWSAAQLLTFVLPFPAVPDTLRVVMVCKVAELGYVVGREVAVEGASSSVSNSPAFGVEWSPGLLEVSCIASVQILNHGGASRTTITLANWAVKVHAGWLNPFA